MPALVRLYALGLASEVLLVPVKAKFLVGFWFLFMGLVSLLFLIASFRTNVVFVSIFLSFVLAFGLLTGAYFQLASDYVGNAALAHKLVVVSTHRRWSFRHMKGSPV